MPLSSTNAKIASKLRVHLCATPGVLGTVAIGWSSGLLASLVCYPLDTVKRQLMLDGGVGFAGKYDGRIVNCVSCLYKEAGLAAFYRGCFLNALKSAPATAMTFVLNDAIRSSIAQKTY